MAEKHWSYDFPQILIGSIEDNHIQGMQHVFHADDCGPSHLPIDKSTFCQGLGSATSLRSNGMFPFNFSNELVRPRQAIHDEQDLAAIYDYSSNAYDDFNPRFLIPGESSSETVPPEDNQNQGQRAQPRSTRFTLDSARSTLQQISQLSSAPTSRVKKARGKNRISPLLRLLKSFKVARGWFQDNPQAFEGSSEEVLQYIALVSKAYNGLPPRYKASSTSSSNQEFYPLASPNDVKQLKTEDQSLKSSAISGQPGRMELCESASASQVSISDIESQVAAKYSKFRCPRNCDGKFRESKGDRLYKCSTGSGWSSDAFAEWKRHENGHWTEDVWFCRTHYYASDKGHDGVFLRKDLLKRHLKGKKHTQHGVVTDVYLERCRIRIPNSEFPRSCAFAGCDAEFTHTYERLNHIAKHFRERKAELWKQDEASSLNNSSPFPRTTNPEQSPSIGIPKGGEPKKSKELEEEQDEEEDDDEEEDEEGASSESSTETPNTLWSNDDNLEEDPF